ncbi:MAG: hypothetical protein OEW73_04790 [Gammaproteobacteria bacterium]|nr:hypothetical protein [Gammaproteobacteria bacterium]MDH5240079.1 hypothetical protein [Gammaproteobacteria bacterium]MDH5260221.1 hypothetical protein [Gammaproteobacteria bacterium]MDH5583032.1 hypothetical protein [Gammaproteobacteria bacterium]
MQAIAKWLVARPYYAVAGLAVTLLLPAPQLFSGAILVLLVLAEGTRLAVVRASVAAAALAAASLLLGGSLTSLVALMVATWVPALLLAQALVAVRSLTLTLQVSVIVAVAALLVFQLAIPDAEAFWRPYLDLMDDIIRQNGLTLNTELLTADVMTVSAVLVLWMLYTGALLLGYGLYRRLPAGTDNYGQFRDLNFGRVIALTLALLSLLAFVIDAALLENIAFIIFVMFMMQGLAIVHWLHGEGKLPLIAVVSVYVLMPFLQVLLIMVLALIGYTDAWIGFRHRFKKV